MEFTGTSSSLDATASIEGGASPATSHPTSCTATDSQQIVLKQHPADQRIGKPVENPRRDVYHVVKIDERGDLTLAVSEAEDRKVSKRFLVCSRTMARASDYFATLLYGPFFEARGEDYSGTTSWVEPLFEDDPEAFEILFDSIHGQWRDVPRELDFEWLLEINLLADKYLLSRQLPRIPSTWKTWSEGEYWNKIHYYFVDTSLQYHKKAVREMIRDVVRLAHWTGHPDELWYSLAYYA